MELGQLYSTSSMEFQITLMMICSLQPNSSLSFFFTFYSKELLNASASGEYYSAAAPLHLTTKRHLFDIGEVNWKEPITHFTPEHFRSPG